MQIRKITYTDYIQHINLYKQLSIIDNVSYEDYIKFVDSLDANHCVFVICDENNRLLGTATILIEQKLIHNMGKVGHIEDVVIDSNMRKCGLGKFIINHLVNYARDMGCYKMILDCSDENIIFYEKNNFKKHGNEMAFYY